MEVKSARTQEKSLRSYFFSFIREYSVYLISLAVIAIIAAIFDIAVRYKIKEIIDLITSDHDATLEYVLVLFVLYKLMVHAAYFFARLFHIRYKPMIMQQIMTTMYMKTVAHSLQWFDSHLSGEISNKIADFQSSMSHLINSSFRALNNMATVLMSLFFLVQVNMLSAYVLAVFVAVYTPIIYWLLKKQTHLQGALVRARQTAIGVINDSIANIFAIKIIGNVETERTLKLDPALENWKKWHKKTRQFDAYVLDNADTIMVTIMSAVQIYLLAYLYRNGLITAGDFAFIAMITLNIHSELDKFLERLLVDINPHVAQIKSSYAFVSKPVDIQDKENAINVKNIKGDIKYNQVSFAYGEGERQVLDNFNLHIKPGEKVGIVGTSGAGKTTLIKSLLRYFDVNSGSISIDGHSITDMTQDSLRKTIAIIPQDITLLHRSIRENLQLAKHDATQQEIVAACKKANIHADIITMSEGYETIVGERGIKLSGGQRQRIAIARALLKDAPILILDEATSSLDTATEKLIQGCLHTLLQTNCATVIAVAHRLSTLQDMDRIIVLERGRIVEQGTHQELVGKHEGAYKKLWDMQVKI